MSDRTHRRRPYVKIATGVLREPWNDQVLATFVRLCAWLSDRWARDSLTAEEACHAILSRHELAVITGRAQLVHSRRALNALGEHVSCAVNARGEYTEISWPKFAEYQNLPGRIARELPVSSPAPSHSPAHSPSKGKRSVTKGTPSTDLFPPEARTGSNGKAEPQTVRSDYSPVCRFPRSGTPEYAEVRAYLRGFRDTNLPAVTDELIDFTLSNVEDWAVGQSKQPQYNWKIYVRKALRQGKFRSGFAKQPGGADGNDQPRAGKVQRAALSIAKRRGISLAGP